MLPQPTAADLIDIKSALGLSAARMADIFGLASSRRWRELESGERRMDAARWSLGLLALGRHPTHRVIISITAPVFDLDSGIRRTADRLEHPCCTGNVCSSEF